MKRVSGVTKAVLTTGLTGLLCLFSLQAQCAGLSITPSAITNDFKGTIVLNITGVSTGETVTVEEYMDVNSNGRIDAGAEYLVRSFTVTDGRVTAIGGVRNLSVPGDEDSLTNGQIRVQLPYPGMNDTLERIAANRLFRIYDPVGGFTPVTNSFTIAQKVDSQSVTGKVTAAGTGVPLANAVVVLAADKAPGSGTVADTNGNFTLYGAPGDYFLVAIQNGFVDDQGAGSVTLSSNSVVAKNLTNLVATQTISGKVSDSASGTGLPGIFVEAETSDNLFSLTFSDPSGNFTLPAVSGQWKVKVGEDSGVAQLGYLAAGNSINTNTTSGSVSNLDIQFTKASALIYGSVKDTHSNAMPGLTIQSDDFSYTYQARGETDGNGNYSVGLFAGNWHIGPDNEALTANGLLGQGTNVSVSAGQALREDFTVLHANTHLRGRAIDSSGAPLSNMDMVVQIFTGQGPGSTSLQPQTQGDGSFDVSVTSGRWNIAMECSSMADRGLVGPSLDFDVVDGVDQSNITLVAMFTTQHISGQVRDNNGTPVNVQMYASATLHGTNYSGCGSNTDPSGNYQLNVCDGNWNVGVSGDLTSRGYDNPQYKSAIVSGADVTANLTIYPLGQTPAVLVPAGFINGHFQLRLNGGPDRKYRIDATTNLNDAASWVSLRTNTAFGGTFDFVDPDSSPARARFYRAVLVP